MNSLRKKRTLFVGLDAACWEYYQPLLDAGRLPAMEGLIRSGSRGVARSTMPAWTPTAWSSIITGKNPGKHGIYDMLWLRPGSYEFSPTDARVRLGTPFWIRLNQAGLKVGLVNVPFGYPPDPVDGFVVTGFGAPSGRADFAFPPDACTWILDRYGEYEPWLQFKRFKNRNEDELIKGDIQHQEKQVAMALALAVRYDVDVLVINLMAPDHANHLASKMETVNQAIIQTDQHLQRLLDGFQPDNVMLFSDHGSRRVQGDFLLHVWLRDQGYTSQPLRLARIRKKVLNGMVGTYFREGYRIPRPLEYIPRRLLVTLYDRWSEARRLKFWDAIERKMPFAHSIYRYGSRLDYGKTKVFPGSSRSGLLYLNLAGRQPEGAVPTGESESLQAELAAKLRSLEDPVHGGSLFNAVHFAGEIYQGPATEYAPDLTLDFYSCPWNIMHTFRRGAYVEDMHHKYFVQNQGEFGHHSRDGLFVFNGPDFIAAEYGRILNMMDLPATLLFINEVPLPEDWDGQVPRNLLSKGLADAPLRTQGGDPETSVQVDPHYSEKEDQQLLEHLKALGYL